MTRRATKIVATLGPASSDPALLEAMIRAGVNVVRLNFSHGKAQDHIDRARMVREAAQRAGQAVVPPGAVAGQLGLGEFAVHPQVAGQLGDGEELEAVMSGTDSTVAVTSPEPVLLVMG